MESSVINNEMRVHLCESEALRRRWGGEDAAHNAECRTQQLHSRLGRYKVKRLRSGFQLDGAPTPPASTSLTVTITSLFHPSTQPQR